jgi:hypothetical protein
MTKSISTMWKLQGTERNYIQLCLFDCAEILFASIKRRNKNDSLFMLSHERPRIDVESLHL